MVAPVLGVPTLHPAALAPQDGSSLFPAGTGSGGWWHPRCPARSASSPAAAWPRSGTGKCWEGSIPGWAPRDMAPPQRAWPTPRPNPGHRAGTSCPVSLPGPWSSAGAQGGSTACRGVPTMRAAAPRAVPSTPAGAGGALGCWVSLGSQERLCQRPLPVQVAVRGCQPAEGGGAAAPAGQPQRVLPDTGEPDQAR